MSQSTTQTEPRSHLPEFRKYYLEYRQALGRYCQGTLTEEELDREQTRLRHKYGLATPDTQGGDAL